MSVMIILSQVGYMMVEMGSIKSTNNTDIQLKSMIVISISSTTFFIFGYGFATKANGGLMGQLNFGGNLLDKSDYAVYLYYYSLCVTMA